MHGVFGAGLLLYTYNTSSLHYKQIKVCLCFGSQGVSQVIRRGSSRKNGTPPSTYLRSVVCFLYHFFILINLLYFSRAQSISSNKEGVFPKKGHTPFDVLEVCCVFSVSLYYCN
jgi:hypothetical protein